MNRRPWLVAALAVTAFASSGVGPLTGSASADVCAGVGRRISVSGCTNVADTVNGFASPPSDYAPLPGDFPPPPPPPPPVHVCVGVGRRVHVSGCS